ncbi:glycosyltransferase family 2 protein [Convivina praedatoris]|uniref:Glycosyltransferase YkoT n=1 Tax=Convivina praedatoris TaxID=2880963 RepID=A0ABN8HD43_9LACO|nr:glycosyltransferase family 2 protein [Convivina sp. LMG 32447]CAH1853662.1 putative glycosyltransferase YkoT [Convivina sp. LMG 32447]CAH1854705.1 putative glycosyltransferase YkoT [Convivina sp. LMG 32447]CAH1855122.1 putative glycosyltransferase YkoT [Convivina sp. LMG 32447]
MIIRQKVPRLGLILPAYNEQEVLKITLTKLRIIRSELVKSGAITADSFIMIVDDGSKDRTWALVNEYEATNPDIIGVKLSRNFGHQPALLAGMSEASKLADIVITLDADLQDNPEIIGQMVAKYHEGYEIVYAVRSSRQTDTWFKRNTALAFYKIAAWLGVDLIPNHADFRLMSKTSVAALMKLPERNLFLRAMVPLLGYPSTEVTYERGKRQAGQSKYPLKKMLTFAIDGITSFSVKPIRFLFDLGILVVGIAGIEIVYTIFEKMFGNPQSGWSSLMISIWLLGGINLIAIGVVGIYIGKIFTEVKQRPRFQIENVTGLKEPENQADISIYKSVNAN